MTTDGHEAWLWARHGPGGYTCCSSNHWSSRTSKAVNLSASWRGAGDPERVGHPEAPVLWSCLAPGPGLDCSASMGGPAAAPAARRAPSQASFCAPTTAVPTDSRHRPNSMSDGPRTRRPPRPSARPVALLRPLCLLPAVRGHRPHHGPRPGCARPARELHR